MVCISFSVYAIQVVLNSLGICAYMMKFVLQCCDDITFERLKFYVQIRPVFSGLVTYMVVYVYTVIYYDCPYSPHACTQMHLYQ